VFKTIRTIEELSKVHEAIRHYVMEAKESVDDLGLVAPQCSDEFNSEQCKIIADRQFSQRMQRDYEAV
jgi:hypothetical protein